MGGCPSSACAVGAGRAVLEEPRQEAASGPRHRGAAERGAGQRGVQRRLRVVVELRVFVERAVPVADVGLVPELPEPAGRDVRVAAVRVRRPGADEIGPLGVVGRGIEAPAVERRDAGVLVGGRVRGERLRHEPELDEGERARAGDCVEDPVGQRPVVDRVAGRVLAVDVGRSPLHRRGAVTAVEEEVIAHVHGRGVRGGDRAEQRRPLRGGRVVDLVPAVKRPDPLERRSGGGGVDRQVHGRGRGRAARGAGGEQSGRQCPGPARRPVGHHQVSA